MSDPSSDIIDPSLDNDSYSSIGEERGDVGGVGSCSWGGAEK